MHYKYSNKNNEDNKDNEGKEKKEGKVKELIIIGAGASGCFLSANLPSFYTNENTLILEKSHQALQKVKISGGGRCNVTHSCFNPKKLSQFYPRGEKELQKIFARFQPSDVIEWFKNRNVSLITEEDGRIFPADNNSQTIVNLLLKEAEKNVEIQYNKNVDSVEYLADSKEYLINTSKGETYKSKKIVICCGSNPKIEKIIKNLSLKIIPQVPALFSFMLDKASLNESLLFDLQGLSFNAEIRIPSLKLQESGALLITHWGISGPAVLRISSKGARELALLNYQFILNINWIYKNFEEVKNDLQKLKQNSPKKSIYSLKIYNLSRRFWERLLIINNINNKKMEEISNKEINKIAETLTHYEIKITNKSNFTHEFVSAGGIDLKEVNFDRMESKKYPNLFFAGEILNIDGLTGGFNFQACWSEAYIISQSI